MSFHEGSTLLGTSSLDSSATAVLSVSTLIVGSHTITATYNGDTNFPPSTSNPATLTVTQRTGGGEGGASLTVTANDASRTTTEANPPFSHTVAGELVNGDTYATAVTGTPTYSTTAGTAAGTFAITVSGTDEPERYVLAFRPRHSDGGAVLVDDDAGNLSELVAVWRSGDPDGDGHPRRNGYGELLRWSDLSGPGHGNRQCCGPDYDDIECGHAYDPTARSL